MRSITLLTALFLTTAGCQCGGNSLIRSYEGDDPANRDAGVSGGGAGGGGGAAATGGGTGGGASAVGGGGGATGGGGGFTGPGWCASDCDCPSGQRCVATTGELTTNECQPGAGTCNVPCPMACGAGTQCLNGACTTVPCLGTNCTSSFATSVQGRYLTYYELDIHEFADKATDIAKLLDVLRAALSGQGATCANQTTPEGQLLCIVVSLIASNIQAPPWVGQLIGVLADAFRFGNSPVRARGVMNLAEQGTQLYASETWSELWLNYNGQQLDVMNSPTLGQNGRITVTVRAYGGVRSATEVILGPREIEFDVNKLLVNLINVAITAASNNQAHDVGELLDLVLCSNIPVTNPNYLVCTSAAQSLASNFELESGLGGIRFTQQRATIYDLDNNGIADALGLPGARGSVAGSMTNGFVSGALGPFPASNWYGTK
ncbi:MAG: hypothetical protein AB1730_25885 [Myxococcota bacterium]